MSDARSSFLAGVRAEAPLLIGVAPFGMIYGALAASAGLSAAAAQGMSSIVFAGAAQFIAVQMLAVGAPLPVLLLTTLVVNLRHTLYSASIAPHLQHLSRRWQVVLAYLLTDEAYVVAITHYQRTDPPASTSDARHWFFLGAGLALWGCWQVSTAAGIFLGSQAPPGWSLDFTLALTFIALLVPTLSERPALAAALTAGVMGVVCAHWPYKLGLVLAALAGIAVGMLFDWQQAQGPDAPPPRQEQSP